MRTKQVFTNKGNGVTYATLQIFQSFENSYGHMNVTGNGKAKCNYAEQDAFDEKVGTKIASMRAEKMAYKLAAQEVNKQIKKLENERDAWSHRADKVDSELNDYINSLKQ